MSNPYPLEADGDFSDLVDRVATHKERIVLTRAGKELVAIVPVEDLEVMEERLDIEDARASRIEAQEKGTVPLATLKKQLGL